jgi:uncharacterized protein (DUF305 family)
MLFRRRPLAAALFATVLLAGCGGLADPFSHEEKANSTDAAFVKAMLAHERAVGSIAELGERKAMRVELRGIARDRLARHRRALSTLNWFQAVLGRQRVPALGARINRGPPRYNARDLSHAVSFDHEFLVQMIQQHEYAMAAAAVERDRGGDTRLKALAGEVYKSSSQDLLKLRKWLHTWYGGDTMPGTPPGQAPAPAPGGGGGPGGGQPPEV